MALFSRFQISMLGLKRRAPPFLDHPKLEFPAVSAPYPSHDKQKRLQLQTVDAASRLDHKIFIRPFIGTPAPKRSLCQECVEFLSQDVDAKRFGY